MAIPQLDPFLPCIPGLSPPGHVRTPYSAPGNGAAFHSQGSEETFIALTGRWEVYWGDEGRESVVLEPFDGMVVPDGVLRGFRNVGEARRSSSPSSESAAWAAACWAESLRPAFVEAAAIAGSGRAW